MLVKTTPLGPDEAITALREAVAAENMRVVHHINGQANARLIGRDVPADQILEIFRPDFAIRVWAAHKPAGIDIPLRIHVYVDAEGGTTVQCRMPREVFAPYGSDALMAVADDLEPVFAAILAAVPEAEHAGAVS